MFRYFLIITMLHGVGCSRYRPEPLSAEMTLETVTVRRSNPDNSAQSLVPAQLQSSETASRAVSLSKAAQWMLQYGPDIQDALAAYRTALSRTQRKTPLPNPLLSVGPQFGFVPDQGTVNPVAPFGSIGFSIPLSKRLRHADELNKAHAEIARIEALSRHRQLYLELREKYADLCLSKLRYQKQHETISLLERATAATRKSAEAGQATALDFSLFELELSQYRSELLQTDLQTAEARAQLARLAGVDMRMFSDLPTNALPEIPNTIPTDEHLRNTAIFERADLAILRARYEAAERALRLEISKQWPDFHFGPSFSSESGEKRTVLGLTLGIEVPFFDRNEQAILHAQKYREELRIQYESQLNRVLGALEYALLKLRITHERNRVLIAEILPLASKHIETVRAAIAAGEGDYLRALEAERAYRKAQLQQLEAELDVRKTWVELERAVGRPLLQFPGEPQQIVSPETNLLPSSAWKRIDPEELNP